VDADEPEEPGMEHFEGVMRRLLAVPKSEVDAVRETPTDPRDGARPSPRPENPSRC